MNSHIYRQTDDRWRWLPYPSGGYYINGSGCGCCAVTHCIIEMEKYKNWTPAKVQPYMKQYATRGNGTTWAGIEKSLKYYGLQNVANIPTMSQLWKELAKGNRVGVLLFGSTKGPDGTVWTTGGHYIAFTNYRVKDGQHQLYLKDSGGRKHDGWYSYEKSMKGDVRQVWIGTIPSGSAAKTTTPTSTSTSTSSNGKLTVDGVGGPATIKALQKYLKVTQDGVLSGQNKSLKKYYPSITSVKYGLGGSATVKALQKWIGVSVDGIWGKATSTALQKKLKLSNPDGICGPNTVKALQKFLNNNSSDGGATTTTTTSTTTATTKTTSTSTTTASTTTSNFKESVIDVSYVQSKSIDWAKVKAAGIAGAIIRCGYRGYGSGALNEDSMFMTHIAGAQKAGLKLGIYFFTEAINAAEGKAEAQYALKLLKKSGAKLTYPIAIDTENISASNPTPRANSNKLSKAKRTEAIKAFCEEIKKNGYEPMIYASTSWLNNQLDMSKLPYTVWVAQYNDKVTYKGKYAIWQFTSTAKVNGINQVVDKSYCYVNYKTSSVTSVTSTALKSIDTVAQEVLNGLWGAGETRKKKLTEAGYDYDKVQAKVNELLKAKQTSSTSTVKPVVESATTPTKSIETLAQEVLNGKWGSGETRKQKLIAAGYNYDAVQKKVNELIAMNQTNSTIYKNMTAWAQKIAKEKYHYVKWKSNISATHTCPICSGRKYDNYYGWNCIGFAFACWHHGGGLKSKCNCGVVDNGTGDKILKATDANALSMARKSIGINEIKVIRNNQKAIPLSMLQEGDIILFFKGNTYYHTAYYQGNGKYADSNTTSGIGHANNIRANKTLSATAKSDLKVAFRYIGATIPQILKSIDVIAQEVLDGKWGAGTTRKNNLVAAGYDYDKVQAKVNELLKAKEDAVKAAEEERLRLEAEKKAEEERLKLEAEAKAKAEAEAKAAAEKAKAELILKLAQEVLDGKWGSGDIRKQKLIAAGYDYDVVQTKVNELVAYNQKIEQIANEILLGKWGNGDERKQKLTAAGYDYNVVQKKVNELVAANTITSTSSGAVKIAHAAHGENGTSSQKAGDQTGSEVCVRSWTYSSNSSSGFHWNVVARCNDATIAKRIAKTAVDASNNKHIGYDKESVASRQSFYKALVAANWDATKITKDVETSCSPFACACINAGYQKKYIKTDHSCTTLAKTLQADKNFTCFTTSDYCTKKDKLKVGDILITTGHHCAIVVQV